MMLVKGLSLQLIVGGSDFHEAMTVNDRFHKHRDRSIIDYLADVPHYEQVCSAKDACALAIF